MSRNGLVPSIQRLMAVEERLRRSTRTPSPFEQLSQQMDDILGDGGILKGVVQPGEGPPISHNASVLIGGGRSFSPRPSGEHRQRADRAMGSMMRQSQS
ncbi:unnamed protein product [Pleuronectes platessa]|uniref:Uncharacterized protein n=1 Tax=Pleuronectes platessa TaxID=8262 RepID=A0A9N7VVS1_PLEPL|nr:unnamed protein product [Pleuronectes platessa]